MSPLSEIIAWAARGVLLKIMAPKDTVYDRVTADYEKVAAANDSIIASQRVISEPNAAITVRTFTLTPEGQEMLSTNAYTLPGGLRRWNRYLYPSQTMPADDLSVNLTKKETEPVSPPQSPQVQPPPKQSSDIWDLI